MSVVDNVAFGLLARGGRRADVQAAVAEMLELVELVPFADRRPSQLSGGQQQRVALARALAIRPDVLLLDEPFGALDRRLRQAMQVKVVELQRRLGVTTIFVTHDQEEALTMSDRIAVMSVERRGFEQIGSPREIYERPSTARVSTFIGQTNLWEETVAKVSADGMIQTSRGLHFCSDTALEPGRAVILSLRPERIALLQPGREAQGGATVLHGRVRETHFVGEVILSLFEADIGIALRVKQLNSDSSVVLEAGAPARIAWMPDALRVLQG
jgi:ABC-type Fe3+/spermidine/putrescine transport system ATPase subunit